MAGSRGSSAFVGPYSWRIGDSQAQESASVCRWQCRGSTTGCGPKPRSSICGSSRMTSCRRLIPANASVPPPSSRQLPPPNRGSPAWPSALKNSSSIRRRSTLPTRSASRLRSFLGATAFGSINGTGRRCRSRPTSPRETGGSPGQTGEISSAWPEAGSRNVKHLLDLAQRRDRSTDTDHQVLKAQLEKRTRKPARLRRRIENQLIPHSGLERCRSQAASPTQSGPETLFRGSCD